MAAPDLDWRIMQILGKKKAPMTMIDIRNALELEDSTYHDDDDDIQHFHSHRSG